MNVPRWRLQQSVSFVCAQVHLVYLDARLVRLMSLLVGAAQELVEGVLGLAQHALLRGVDRGVIGLWRERSGRCGWNVPDHALVVW